MKVLRFWGSFLLCMLACYAFCGDGRRIAFSSFKKAAAAENKSEVARIAAETLTPARSKPLELEAERKMEQELSSIQDAIRQGLNPYGSKAWRAVHGVNIGMECQDSGVQVAAGGSTIVSVYKKSPKMCSVFCEETEGCVAWSWNKNDVDKNCCAQHSCLRQVPKSNMVSGMKASFDGIWFYKSLADPNDFSIDEPESFDWFEIVVGKTGEMSFENADGTPGVLKAVGGSANDGNMGSEGRALFAHEGLLGNAELEANVIASELDDAGTVQMRLADGQMRMKAWIVRPENNFTECTAEKKEVRFQLYDRVTVKQDQVIDASHVRLCSGNGTDILPFILKEGDGGTVNYVHHPRKTGVAFDQDPGKIVWVNDTLLVRSAILEEVSEDEVSDVLENLGGDLIHAIQDPITLEIFRDPVMASDGFTYERSAMERLITRAEESEEIPKSPMTREALSSVKLSSNYAIRSLVSSVVEKVSAARAAAGKIQKRFRGYRLRKAVLGRGNVPAGWWATS